MTTTNAIMPRGTRTRDVDGASHELIVHPGAALDADVDVPTALMEAIHSVAIHRIDVDAFGVDVDVIGGSVVLRTLDPFSSARRVAAHGRLSRRVRPPKGEYEGQGENAYQLAPLRPHGRGTHPEALPPVRRC